MTPRRTPAARAAADDGIILGWLARLVVTLAIGAVLGFDALSVAVTSVTTQDAAATVAREARDAAARGRDPLAAAERAADREGVRIVRGSLVADRDGGMSVSVVRRAPTVALDRTPWRDVARRTAEATVNPSVL